MDHDCENICFYQIIIHYYMYISDANAYPISAIEYTSVLDLTISSKENPTIHITSFETDITNYEKDYFAGQT